MMLMLKAVGDECAFSREVGEYLPLHIAYPNAPSSIDELYYWRCTGQDQLLEIRLASSTGILAGLDVILIPSHRLRSVEKAEPIRPRRECRGLPIVDLQPWKKQIGAREFGIAPSLRRADDTTPFTIEISQNAMTVSFSSEPDHTLIINHGSRFGFTESGVLRVIVIDLTPAEVALLRSAFVA